MEKLLSNYSLDEIESAKGKIKMLEVRRKEFIMLKEKLENEFGFEIVNYILDDILDYETYHHICLMVNMAIVNKRLFAEEGDKLKKGIKALFKVKNDYDRVDKKTYIGEVFDFEKWYKKYSNKEIVDLKKHLSQDNFDIIKKLDIEIKNKIYTEQEFEYLDMDLLAYYIADDMDEEELKESKPLPENVSREEYNNLLEKINKISIEYSF